MEIQEKGLQKPEDNGQGGQNLEESLGRIEEIIRELEKQEISLADSLRLYKEGVELVSFCQDAITGVEKEIEILEAKDI